MMAQVQDAETLIPQPFSPFSLMPYQDDYWHRAHDRNCFKDDESNVHVGWTDIDAEHRATMRVLKSLADIQSYTRGTELHPSGLRVMYVRESKQAKLSASLGSNGTVDPLVRAILGDH